MPYKLELTWVPHARKWKKKYQGKQYYLKTKCSGKNDRDGYLNALREWERLKNFLDGFGPNPYTPTGVLIPEHLQTGIPAPAPAFVPVALPDPPRYPIGWSFQSSQASETPKPENIKTQIPVLQENRGVVLTYEFESGGVQGQDSQFEQFQVAIAGGAAL
jgi:hypothetical protein